MKAEILRKKFIDFFKKKGHQQIPFSSLIPQDDPTTLFTGSGMQQLVPFLKGKTHPMGKRLVNLQPCFRAEDIEEVGDNRHTTFFEMLGNWSLGDYFKLEQLTWFFEFITKVVGLNKKRLYVTVFAGNKNIPKDTESIKIWQELFKIRTPARKGKKGFDSKIKIYTYGGDKNWWSRVGAPENMPPYEIGGPDSEVFYDFDPQEKLQIHQHSHFKNKVCHLNCDCGRFLEIGNSVFMEYEKQKDGTFKTLPNKNVDFGGGLERIVAASQNQIDIFDIDIFKPVIKEIEKFCGKGYQSNKESMRVIADHLRAATFMIAEGLEPDNKLQGYILRRLLRRAAVKMHQLKDGLTPIPAFKSICKIILKNYQDYFDENKTRMLISKVIDQEMGRFAKSLDKGLIEIKKVDPKKVDARFAFNLFQTYGFPFEISFELLAQKNIYLDKKDFDKEFAKHRELSRTASKGMFKGGLADHSEEIKNLHTATHLLHEALRRILGKDVKQVGSNITHERLRFDFTHPKSLSEKEITNIETLINKQIDKNLPVKVKTMSLKQAYKNGALAFFGQKYPERVKVYFIGNFSAEVCGGPHMDFTGALGKFKIKKEESCGAGKRRIYAVVLN